MLLRIKNASAVHIEPTTEEGCLDVHIDGIKSDDLLIHVDILAVIKYYGITEILDTIGEEQLRAYMEFAPSSH